MSEQFDVVWSGGEGLTSYRGPSQLLEATICHRDVAQDLPPKQKGERLPGIYVWTCKVCGKRFVAPKGSKGRARVFCGQVCTGRGQLAL